MSEKTPERIALEETAKELGLSIPGNIGDAKLADRVAKAQAKAKKTPPPAAVTPAASGVAPAGTRDGGPAGTNGAITEAQDDAGRVPAPAAEPQSAEVEVIGPRKGRWRIGRKFGQTPTRIPLAELDEAQLDALKGDSALVVLLPDVDE